MDHSQDLNDRHAIDEDRSHNCNRDDPRITMMKSTL